MAQMEDKFHEKKEKKQTTNSSNPISLKANSFIITQPYFAEH
jgi:hypothetical protein